MATDDTADSSGPRLPTKPAGIPVELYHKKKATMRDVADRLDGIDAVDGFDLRFTEAGHIGGTVRLAVGSRFAGFNDLLAEFGLVVTSVDAQEVLRGLAIDGDGEDARTETTVVAGILEGR